LAAFVRKHSQFGGIFIAIGALFGLLFGHGAIVGAVVGLVVSVLILGVEWISNRAARS